MAEIINLRTARKAGNKAASKAKADASAAMHGRTKALKALEKARAEKENAKLDGHLRHVQD